MNKFIKDLFTERDNVTWCIARVLAASAAMDMLVKFYQIGTPAFQDFAVGIAAIIAAIGYKNLTEKDK